MNVGFGRITGFGEEEYNLKPAFNFFEAENKQLIFN